MLNRTAISTFLCLLCCYTLYAQPVVQSRTPTRNNSHAALTSNVSATFSQPMAAPTGGTFRVHSNMRGYLAGNYSGGGSNTLTFDPANNLLPGEEIEAILTKGMPGAASGALAKGDVWRFRGGVTKGPARLDQVVKTLGGANPWDCKFGDLDKDGDLDFISVNFVGQSYVYLNDGSGNFTATPFGSSVAPNYAVALADMDNDGDLDIITGAWGKNSGGGSDGQKKIWLNNGSGAFPTSIGFGSNTAGTMDIDVGDLDGDGDMDVVCANGGVSDEANDIFINDGSGQMTRRGFLLFPQYTFEVTDNSWATRLADVDNDGDLDVIIGNFGLGGTQQSYVYLNDGAGNFNAQSRVNLGAPGSVLCAGVGDFDDDGDVDIALGGNWNYASYIYWNANADFSLTTQLTSGSEPVWAFEAGDVNGDGKIDLGVGMENSPSYVLRNQGSQALGGSYQLGGSGEGYGLAFADIDGDGDVDVGLPDRICVNGGNPPVIAVTSNSNPVSNGGAINISYGATLASLGININVTDADGNTVALSAQITNLTSQGILPAQFSKANSSVPYNVAPTSGTFNQGSSVHRVTLTATDITEVSVFTFDFIVGAAPGNTPPEIIVMANGGLVTNGSGITVNHGTTLLSLNMSITVDDADFDNTALTGSVSNAAGTGIVQAEFNAPSQAVVYYVMPFNGVFNNGLTVHAIALTANDGRGGMTQFLFSIQVGPAPSPILEVYETSTANPKLVHGAQAAGDRDFGTVAVGQATAALSIVIRNGGNGAMQVSGVTLGGSSTHFVLDTTGLASSLAAGATTTFTVAFDPQSGGVHSANVEIAHNDTTQTTPFVFEVRGTGTTAPALAVEQGSALSSGGTVDFGTHALGTTPAPRIVTIRNNGSADLQLGTPSLAGLNAVEFSLDLTGFNATVAPGASTSFSVSYASLAAGIHTASFSFSHNDAAQGSTFTANLAGSTVQQNQPGISTGSDGSGGGGCAAGAGCGAWMIVMLGAACLRRRRK